MNDSHAPEITFQHIGSPIAVSKQVETNIYRIIQELVLNAIKHADAKSIDVQIGYGEDQIQVSVEDDGKGYDVDYPNSDGIGLSNIESRIGFLQGEKDVISNERGTSVTVAIDTKKLK
jgi:signal transduction histidine kinase